AGIDLVLTPSPPWLCISLHLRCPLPRCSVAPPYGVCNACNGPRCDEPLIKSGCCKGVAGKLVTSVAGGGATLRCSVAVLHRCRVAPLQLWEGIATICPFIHLSITSHAGEQGSGSAVVPPRPGSDMLWSQRPGLVKQIQHLLSLLAQISI